MALGFSAYLVTLNLAASEHQSALMQQLKSRGDDVIQTGSGLCVKTLMNDQEFKAFVCAVASDGIKFERVDASSGKDKLTPDVQAFLGG